MSGDHINYMQMALDLAKQGQLTVSPNPMVGCVIVKDKQIIGRGYHQTAGGPHAEIIALKEAGSAAREATVYITLEPCAHHGRTPPCISALIEAGIKEVYAASEDPNPLVAGKGVQALQTHGISVHLGLLQAEAQQLNEIFFHYMRYQRPFVISKWAMSLDGKTVTAPGDDKTISSKSALEYSHALRQQVDAILVGAKTAIEDDPLLTVRHCNATPVRQPIRIILAGNKTLPNNLKMFDADMPAKTIIATTATEYPLANSKNIEILLLPKNKDGRVDLSSLLKKLGELGITSLLVEGGMTVHESFFREQLVNKLCVNIAPVIIGSQTKKLRLDQLKWQQNSDNFMVTTIGGTIHV